MSDDRDLQEWFKRSVEELPREPFTLALLERVRRRERTLCWQRYAAQLVAFASFCLLLPELIEPLNKLASLPLLLIELGGARWPVLFVLLAGALYALIKHARNTGLLRGVRPWS